MHAPKRGDVEICNHALIDIDRNGTIAAVTRADAADYDRKRDRARQVHRLVETPERTFLLPGLIDLHIHAPQWPQLGKALDVPLEIWLQQHTFPLESRYADAEFARRIYADLVSSLLAHGTTTAVYFATIHAEATSILAATCLSKGQRALVGKVVMDEPEHCPDYYRDPSAEQALDETRGFIEYVRAMPGNADGFVRPIVTPRFIPSCTDTALEGLGRIAEECGCHVQTHCSESDWQHNHVLNRTGKTDSDALDGFGLLGRHTILAHSNFISEADMDRIGIAGAGIAHCPLSNVYFAGAVFPLRRALEKSLRIGLGTDIAGGPSPSMFDACRHAIASSRTLEGGVDPSLMPERRGLSDSRIDFRDAFYLATAGGADVLDLPIGRFQAGCHFDAILVDPDAAAAPMALHEDFDTLDDQLQKIVNLAARANIAAVWTQGRLVSPGRD